MKEKEYTDYRMMLGITDRMTDKELDDTISIYEEQLKKYAEEHSNIRKKYDFFVGNVQGLNKMRWNRYKGNLRKNFKLKKEHVLLLSEMSFEKYPNGGDFVFLGVDGQRPFGNSDIYNDVARILEIKINEDGELSKRDMNIVEKLLDELPIAIEYLIKKEMKNLK